MYLSCIIVHAAPYSISLFIIMTGFISIQYSPSVCVSRYYLLDSCFHYPLYIIVYSTFCPTLAYVWTVVVVKYIFLSYKIEREKYLKIKSLEKAMLCGTFFPTICGYFVCFWVSHQTVVLYSFFWWLRLTNFWSRTRTQAIFGQKRKKGKQGYLEQCVLNTNIFLHILFYVVTHLHNFSCPKPKLIDSVIL